jgi:CBS domain-containing protein
MNTDTEPRAREVHRTRSPHPRPRPHLTVADVMSTQLVTVTPETGFKRMASLMRAHRISGLPVVDSAGHPIGVVSESDLLTKARRPRASRLTWLHPGLTLEHARARGTCADEVMTSPAQTIPLHAGLTVTARRLHAGGVRRLLVVDENDRLTGVVTRNDLLKVFLRRDDDIQRDVEGTLDRWAPSFVGRVTVSVQDGVVTLRGEGATLDDVDALVALIGMLDSVVDVDAAGVTSPTTTRRQRDDRAAIRTEDLSKSFGAVHALRDLSKKVRA